MKKLSIILATLLLCVCACKKHKVLEGHMEHQGVFYPNPVPVQYDSNGDGKIDASDAYIEVLGGNLLVSATPNGGALYSGETEGVRNGIRYCYKYVDRNCDKNGSLYSMETALNGNWGTLLQNAEANMTDKNSNGVWDFIDEITNSSYITDFSLSKSAAAAKEFMTLLTEATKPYAPAPSVQGVMQEAINRVITETLEEILAENDTYIDITRIQEVINRKVASAIIYSAIEYDWSTNNQLDAIATTVAKNAADAVGTQLAGDALTQMKKELAGSNNVQGLCPNGFHVPSDADWIMFEMALGMPALEAMQSGIEITNRGAAAKVVEKMVSTHGFTYGGYMTENELFTSNNKAGVFISSSVGADEEGFYMWVREISKDYTGVVRYKHYAPSGLSIRCFKN